LNNHYPHPLIAKEGWFFLSVAFIATILVSFFSIAWSLPFWIVTFFVLQFFRDPARIIPKNPAAILSPADGRIVAVERTVDPYANREALKISVFMNVFNVHSNRSPIEGKIENVQYFPGKFINASLNKASSENERNALVIRSNNGQVVTCVQIAGLIARRILCYVKVNDPITPGQRYGFIRFGSRVDVYLSASITPRVVVGDKVFATETVLADF
jgi:phosphatidylserine decarboxylase